MHRWHFQQSGPMAHVEDEVGLKSAPFECNSTRNTHNRHERTEKNREWNKGKEREGYRTTTIQRPSSLLRLASSHVVPMLSS